MLWHSLKHKFYRLGMIKYIASSENNLLSFLLLPHNNQNIKMSKVTILLILKLYDLCISQFGYVGRVMDSTSK